MDAEEAAVCSVECRDTVIAPGGSAVCRPAAIEHLCALGTVVYLRLPPAELMRRLDNIKTRGIAMAPGETLEEVFAYRAPLYEKYAHITVDAMGQTLEETVSAVLRALVCAENG